MAQNNDDLLVALMNKINTILNAGDDVAPAKKNSYVAWCRPGIPFQPEDLQFAVKGISGKDGAETATLVRTAAEFSRVVNDIPDTTAGSYEQNGKMAWDTYNKVLTQSQVPDADLTQAEKDKINKFRAMFVQTVIKKDIMTDADITVVEDSPLMKVYNTKKAAYDDASLEYNAKRLAALNADTPLAVQDFTMNGSTYRSRVKNALADWATNGYKDDVDKMNAYISQVSQRSMTLLKADLLDKFNKGKLTDPSSGQDFWLSSFYPGNFVNNTKGWTKFTFSSKDKNTYAKDTQTATSAGASGSWGLWSAGADGSKTKDTKTSSLDQSDFLMEFSIAQVTIGRPWMSPDFLTTSAWRWKGTGDLLSNGADQPLGLLPAYATTAFFVKDIKITSSAVKEFNQQINESMTAGGSVGWGPFKVKASHSSSSNEVKSNVSEDGKTLTVEGMQLIAFRCTKLPVSPNPDPKTKNWV